MRSVPAWLERLLDTNFFNVCRTHADAARSECNMFCLDCTNVNAFCFYCRSSRHKDHRVIQIRRSSYHDVVRVSEIEKVLDTSGVQTYVINSARVLFLNERPQPKAAGKLALTNNSHHHACHICGRTLLDTFRFCSLGCKVVGIKGNVMEASFTLDSKNDEVVRRQQRVSNNNNNNNIVMSSSSTRKDEEEEDDEDNEDEEEEMCEGSSQQDMYPPTPHPPPPLRRSRKGIPQRAPFRS